eukprot:TRINITY_DN8931_c0_g1_i3.p1 TRINITY_DN8931_c0_g1~~TRINITY_DN8931_c0_g1_i3.p1  ORF type:complete len:223 (+),score=20.30 TRINITY_DN8931_c0_g1_i3:1-669(+)
MSESNASMLKLIALVSFLSPADSITARLFLNSPLLDDGVPIGDLNIQLKTRLEALARMPQGRLRSAEIRSLGTGLGLYVEGNSDDMTAIKKVFEDSAMCFNVSHGGKNYALVAHEASFAEDVNPDGDSYSPPSFAQSQSKQEEDGYTSNDLISIGVGTYFTTLVIGIVVLSGRRILSYLCGRSDVSNADKAAGNTTEVDGFQPFHTTNPLLRSTSGTATTPM